ncbi:MAG: hypothetical protein RL392_1806 [Pseudomonadota bacterium]|jgi:uncharacterized protein
MKYLLVFLVVLLVAWRWRSAREAQQTDIAKKKAAAHALPVDVVECGHCGVHVPRVDAIQGRLTMYCTPLHRNLAES